MEKDEYGQNMESGGEALLQMTKWVRTSVALQAMLGTVVNVLGRMKNLCLIALKDLFSSTYFLDF